MLTHLTYSIRLLVLLYLATIALTPMVVGQCDGYVDEQLSPKLANYLIEADLDRSSHTAICTQQLVWTNSSPDTLEELRFYMYMNAFKTRKSTYLNGISEVFGANLNNMTPDEYGYINIQQLSTNGKLSPPENRTYIQPNDGNKHDESVLSLVLTEPLLPGQQIAIDLDFEVKLPKTIVRSGYGKNGFHLFVHWFPQIGVYEKDRSGEWGWNCHQFMQKTEFYADFGNYDVTITTDRDFVVGGSGCRVSEDIVDGKKVSRFVAYDIIDFGWTAYPLFESYLDRWQDVDIELLIPGEHCAMAPRYIDIVKKALAYLDEHVGEYHYPKITIVDPPVHTLRSGFMEYPMLITVASVYGTPRAFRGSESLAIHELTHMYFMGMLANNEKEEAWLDEGFVTFYEDEILDHYYGDKGSFYDLGLVRTGNAQKSRQEYTTLGYPEFDIIAKPGWENKGYFKPLMYGKTATTLRTFKNIVGPAAFDRLMRYYFDKHKFTHPREADWLAAVDTMMSTLDYVSPRLDHKDYWQQALHTTHTVDYEVVSIDTDSSPQTFSVRNNGDFDIPTTILVTHTDGTETYYPWDGAGTKTISTSAAAAIHSVHIDPEYKVALDLNYVNNSHAVTPLATPTRAASDAGLVSQVLLHLLSLFL